MAKQQVKILYMTEENYNQIQAILDELKIIYQIMDKYPHCYGEMTWILKYHQGQEPWESICSCRYRDRCYKLTRGIEG